MAVPPGAVNLERRAYRTDRQRVAGQRLDRHPVRVLAIQQPPRVDLPGFAPAGPRRRETAAIRAPRRARGCRAVIWRPDATHRCETCRCVLRSSLSLTTPKLAVATDLVGAISARSRVRATANSHPRPECRRLLPWPRTAPDDLMVHGRSGNQTAVLKVGWGADQPAALWVAHQEIDKELGSAFSSG